MNWSINGSTETLKVVSVLCLKFCSTWIGGVFQTAILGKKSDSQFLQIFDAAMAAGQSSRSGQPSKRTGYFALWILIFAFIGKCVPSSAELFCSTGWNNRLSWDLAVSFEPKCQMKKFFSSQNVQTGLVMTVQNVCPTVRLRACTGTILRLPAHPVHKDTCRFSTFGFLWCFRIPVAFSNDGADRASIIPLQKKKIGKSFLFLYCLTLGQHRNFFLVVTA